MYKQAIVNNLIKLAEDKYISTYLDEDDLAPLYAKYKGKNKPYSKGAVIAATLLGAGMGALAPNVKGPGASATTTALSSLLGAGLSGGVMHLAQKARKSEEEDMLDSYLYQTGLHGRKTPEDIKYFKAIADGKADMDGSTDLENKLQKMLAKKMLKKLK